MYGLEQLFSKSSQAGTDLTNFNAVLGGQTVQTLQQYQYAARQVGVSNEEVASSFKSLQGTATKIRFGIGRPSGLGQVQQAVGLTSSELDEMMKKPELLLLKLQQYLQKEKNIGLGNEVAKSFGLSDNLIAASRRNAFTPEAFKNAPTYSDKEVATLDKSNIAWSNLGNSIQMAIGHLNAAHGLSVVKEFTTLVNVTEKLISDLLTLSEKLQLFKGIKFAIEGWDELFKGITMLSSALAGIDKNTAGLLNISKLFENISNTISTVLLGLDKLGALSFFSPEITKGTVSPAVAAKAKESEKGGFLSSLLPSLMPTAPTGSPILQKASNPVPNVTNAPSSATNTQNVTVNQNLTFPTSTSKPDDHAKAVNKAVKDAFRQLPSQVQGS